MQITKLMIAEKDRYTPDDCHQNNIGSTGILKQANNLQIKFQNCRLFFNQSGIFVTSEFKIKFVNAPKCVTIEKEFVQRG